MGRLSSQLVAASTKNNKKKYKYDFTAEAQRPRRKSYSKFVPGNHTEHI
jgi:hypothetical protein